MDWQSLFPAAPKSAEEKRGVYLTKICGRLLTALVNKGILTREEAQEIVAQAKEDAA